MPQVAGPRLATIEGQQTLVVERRPPLQPTLDRLLSSMTIARRFDVHPTGARAECEQQREHRFASLATGRHVGLDGIVRDLHVQMCTDCSAVCVRDVSFDVSIAGEPVPRGGAAPRRRDVVLGWYSGKRRAGREFK